MNNIIISADEVIKALINGFEVLMIDKSKTNRYGVSCIPLTEEIFSDIESYVMEDAPNKIYLQTERCIKEENKNEK